MFSAHFFSGIYRICCAGAVSIVLTLLFVPSALATGVYSQVTASGSMLLSDNFFFVVVLSLFQIGLLFWIGAQLWHAFVAVPTQADKVSMVPPAEQRFWRIIALPLLCVLLLLNPVILFVQAFALANGEFERVFLLLSDLWISRFGLCRLLIEFLLFLALGISFLMRQRAQQSHEGLSWLQLLLAFALLITLVVTGPSLDAPVQKMLIVSLTDLLTWLCAALWLGGLLYLVLVGLPAVRTQPLQEQSRELHRLGWCYLRVLLIGGIGWLVTGWLNASNYLTDRQQLFTTRYGITIVVVALSGCVLFIAALITSLLLLRRRQLFEKHWQGVKVSAIVLALLAMLLIGGMTTVTNAAALFSPPTTSGSGSPAIKPLERTFRTTDGQLLLQLRVSPARFGLNTFTIQVLDSSNGMQASSLKVILHAHMTAMDMGTQPVPMHYRGANQWSVQEVLSMSGQWRIQLRLQAPDASVHEANVDIAVPF